MNAQHLAALVEHLRAASWLTVQLLDEIEPGTAPSALDVTARRLADAVDAAVDLVVRERARA